jgi:hypothetical protein
MLLHGLMSVADKLTVSGKVNDSGILVKTKQSLNIEKQKAEPVIVVIGGNVKSSLTPCSFTHL